MQLIPDLPLPKFASELLQQQRELSVGSRLIDLKSFGHFRISATQLRWFKVQHEISIVCKWLHLTDSRSYWKWNISWRDSRLITSQYVPEFRLPLQPDSARLFCIDFVHVFVQKTAGKLKTKAGRQIRKQAHNEQIYTKTRPNCILQCIETAKVP